METTVPDYETIEMEEDGARAEIKVAKVPQGWITSVGFRRSAGTWKGVWEATGFNHLSEEETFQNRDQAVQAGAERLIRWNKEDIEKSEAASSLHTEEEMGQARAIIEWAHKQGFQKSLFGAAV